MLGQLPSRQLYAAVAQRVDEEVVQLVGRRWSSEFKELALIAMTERALAQVFATAVPDGQEAV